MAPSKAPQPHRDYSHVPLAKKLGIVSAKGPVGEVALLAAPEGFAASLGEIEGVAYQPGLRAGAGLVLAFARSRRELEPLLELLSAQLPATAHVWIIHPKAHAKPDFNQNDVRTAALAAGFVDYKVCSVNQDWSGLKFSRRKA